MKKIIVNNQVIISGINTKELMDLFRPMVREVIKQEREKRRENPFPSSNTHTALNSLTAIRKLHAEKQD